MIRLPFAALAVALALPAAAQDLEANKELVRRQFEEVISQGNLDLLDETVTEGFIQHNEGSGAADDTEGAGSGRETLRRYLTQLREEIPDFELDIQLILAEDDLVSVYAIGRGTHTGTFFGMPATGQEFTYATFDIFRVEDGRLAEHWDAVDRLGVMQRIGLIPLSGTGAQDEAAE